MRAVPGPARPDRSPSCFRAVLGLTSSLNAERLRKLTENYVVSNAKIKASLGIDRMPVRAEEGIVRTIKSFSL